MHRTRAGAGPLAVGGPAHDPVVDLVRAVALVVVVLGHWVMQGLYVDDAGRLHRDGLLGLAAWTHPLTVLLQVMPAIFVVGGYANARSWRRARAQGLGYGGWLQVRVLRLTRPLVPLLAFWVVAAPLAAYVGLGDGWLGVATRASLVPTWFLAVYLVVTACTPAVVVAWDRWGPWTLAAGAALAALVDLVDLTTPLAGVAGANVLVVWLAVHQLGVAWQDGWLVRHAVPLAGLGAVALLLLVTVGPFGVSMVGEAGDGVSNTFPPRATLLALGMVQAGVAVAARPLLEGIAGRRVPATLTALLGVRLMTLYLWHLTVLGIVTAVALRLGGVGLHARPDTAAWWWQRPAWFVVLGLVTAAVVALVGRFEHVPTATEAGPRRALPALAVVLTTTVGLSLLASGRLLAEDGVRWWLPLLVLLPPLLLGRRAASDVRTAPDGTFGPADGAVERGTIAT